jgi:hypothetical protein
VLAVTKTEIHPLSCAPCIWMENNNVEFELLTFILTSVYDHVEIECKVHGHVNI